MIQTLGLRESVSIIGSRFSFGQARVIVSPSHKPGWFLRTREGDVLLEPRMLRLSRFHHTLVRHEEHCVRIVEHLLSLRAGVQLDSVVLDCTGALPYGGGAAIFWTGLKTRTVTGQELTPYRPTRVAVSSRHRTLRTARSRFIEYKPGKEDILRVRIRIDYGTMRIFDFEFPRDYEAIVASRPRGRDRLYRVAKVASRFGWQHFDEIAWEKEIDPEALLAEEARHRALDLLGDFALIAPPGTYLVGQFDSVCGGHYDDFDLLQKMIA